MRNTVVNIFSRTNILQSVEKSKDSEIADVQSKASQLETQLALSRHTNKTTVAALGLLQQQTNGLRQELNKISLDARAGTDNAVAAVSVLIKQDISKRVKVSNTLISIRTSAHIHLNFTTIAEF